MEAPASLLALLKKHQVMMFQDRGYTVPPEEQAWLTDTGTSYDAVYTSPSVWVHFVTTIEALKTDETEEMMSEMRPENVQRVFLVVPERPQTRVWEVLNQYAAEVWTYAQLGVNPTRHFLAQRHVPVTAEEKHMFYSTTKIDPQCLPFMYVSDPVARWYGFRVGQLIRIERNSLIGFTSAQSVFYRLVVSEPLSEHATKVQVKLFNKPAL